jgi:DNA repair protein RecN (Recombination protein N)
MLKELCIRDFKILRNVTLAFHEGLTAITGETGAGKTQCLEALQAVIGERVGDDVISSGVDKCEITATFDLQNRLDVLKTLTNDGWIDEGENELILERTIERGGRSRARLNGRRVPIGTLQAVGDKVVDLLGQNARADLLTRPALEILDSMGDENHRDRVGEIRELHTKWQNSIKAYKTEKAEIEQAKERRELIEFQHSELDKANLKPGEEAVLTKELELLESAKDRIEGALKAASLLNNENDETPSARDILQEALTAVEVLASADEKILEDAQKLRETVFLTDELAETFRHYAGNITDDPGRRGEVENRIFTIHQLKRKYKTDETGLVALRDKLSAELERVNFASDRLKELAGERDRLMEIFRAEAITLSKSRAKLAKKISGEVKKYLADLDLPNASFEAVLTSAIDDESTWTAGGIDHAELMISTNPAQDPGPLKKIASGGELSRLLIALKSVLAKRDRVPVLIFDEAEAGIGGETAFRVEEKLVELSGSHQLILVSHLPQIASQAHGHWVIEKSSDKKGAVAQARDVKGEDRVAEISRMLGARGDKKALEKLARSFIKGG